MDDSGNNISRHGGFTLTELLVAVVVLLVVILAVGRIFGTASQVVKSGEANAAILQESAAFETLLRKDMARISSDGFLVINCTAVQNDINLASGGELLDPRRLPHEWLRCDQLVFLTDSPAISRQATGFDYYSENTGNAGGTYSGDGGGGLYGPVPQSALSRIYYGHGVQFPYLPANSSANLARWYQDNNSRTDIKPWFRPDSSNAFVDFATWPNLGSSAGSYNGSQPDATDWSLARQELLIADDQAGVFPPANGYQNGDERYYLSGSANRKNSAATRTDWDLYALLGPDAATSRVDVAGTDLPRIRYSLENYQPGVPASSAQLGNLLYRYWPRAEKRPAALELNEAMTTMSTLGSNCSSFEVEWTWADGTGSETSTDAILRGVRYGGGILPNGATDYSYQTPWFGLGVGALDENVRSAVGHPNVIFYPPFGNGVIVNGPVAPEPVVLSVIESGYGNPNTDKIIRYTALFGFNRDEPFLRDGSGSVVFFDGNPLYKTNYTPWPSALRVSMVVHDSDGNIEGGRRVEFTVPLPRRVLDLAEE